MSGGVLARPLEHGNVAREVRLAIEKNNPIAPAILEEVTILGRLQYQLAGVRHRIIGTRPDGQTLDQLDDTLKRQQS